MKLKIICTVVIFVLASPLVPSFNHANVTHSRKRSGQCMESCSLQRITDAMKNNLCALKGLTSDALERYKQQQEARISRLERRITSGISTDALQTYKQQQDARISRLEQNINYANPCFLKSEASTNPSISFSDLDFLYRSGYAKVTKFRYNLKNRPGFETYIGCFGLQYGSVPGPCHGEDGDVQTVTLESDEFITGITGKSGTVIDKISIKTNKRTYGPYGGIGGKAFTIEPSGSRLAYMEGTTDGYLTSLKPVFYSQQTVFLPSHQPVCG